jgi:hypothetical protein
MNNFSNNNTAWTDLNDAEDQREYALIPPKTLAKVIMVIRPGGYDDLSQGWAGGYATRSEKTGAIYLNAKFTLLEGPFAKRVVFGLIGLSSPKGPEWSNIGRSFLRAILNSARGIRPADNSQEAQSARRIKGFADLDSIEFVARIDVEKDQNGDDKNVIKAAIQPEHKDYAALMGNVPRGSSGGGSNGGSGGAAPLTVARVANSAPPVSTRPAWAS